MYSQDQTKSAQKYYKEQTKKVESQMRIYQNQLHLLRGRTDWLATQQIGKVKQLIRYCELQLWNCKSHLEKVS